VVALMPEIYGPKKRFATRLSAENFERHLTRELTAGGIPHWVEIREDAGGWVPFVHESQCTGGASCSCMPRRGQR
jgi:hypothetical protein